MQNMTQMLRQTFSLRQLRKFLSFMTILADKAASRTSSRSRSLMFSKPLNAVFLFRPNSFSVFCDFRNDKKVLFRPVFIRGVGLDPDWLNAMLFSFYLIWSDVTSAEEFPIIGYYDTFASLKQLKYMEPMCSPPLSVSLYAAMKAF